MNTANRSFRVLLATTFLVATLAACGGQGTGKSELGSSGSESTVDPITSSVPATPIASKAPEATDEAKELEEQGTEVIIYRTDEELLNMVEQKINIVSKDEVELINKTIAEFQKDNEEGGVSLWKGIHFLSVDLKDNVLTLDIHIPDEARLGAPGELQLVESLKKTLFQFSFIEGINLLVVGEPVESLMGHVDIEHPILKSE